METTYVGERRFNDERYNRDPRAALVRDRGDPVVYVREYGGVRSLRHITVHSPSGFEWGYGGSGPSDLAIGILADALGLRTHREVKDQIWRMHQDFKFAFVARFDHEGWTLQRDVVTTWVDLWRKAHSDTSSGDDAR